MAGEQSKLSAAINEFSQKLSRFNKADDAKLNIQPSESTKFDKALSERNEKLKKAVVATYKIYKSPFEALGAKSARADAIVKDEEALYDACKIYKACMEIQNEINGDDKNQVAQTYIKTLEIHSPLAEKSSYTTGGQMVYLIAWLFFEKSSAEFYPFFTQIGGTPENPAIHYVLDFVNLDDATIDDHDLEILNCIKNEFYGGEIG
ncbi:MAG: hypothetical protein K6G52_04370 [Treponemataceae bacterium]|nr:hypothetical protein [Treponemataceae bacterium]